MKGLLNKRDFAVFRKVHFGWNGVNPKNPSKPTFRPFGCVEEMRNKMLVKECPACIYYAEWNKKLDALKVDEDRELSRIETVGREQNATPGPLAAAKTQRF